jgi:CRISPR-associated endonuclease Csn1
MNDQTFPPLVGKDHPITKLPKTFPTSICDELTLGIDIGVGSCGLAMIHRTGTGKPTIKGLPEFPAKISFLGVRTFDLPEVKEKTGLKLKNPGRRASRLLRRAVARRAQRMRSLRRLLISEGLLPETYSIQSDEWQQKHVKALPWIWRVEALDRQLHNEEWAMVLIHFAKHRGFRSNRKSDLATKGEKGGTLDSTQRNHEALQDFRTVGEMFTKDARFSERKRNREGSYTSVVLRSDLLEEVGTLFAKQRNFGNPHATAEFEDAYIRVLQTQRPLQDPMKLLEDCPFELGQKRGGKNAPSFELSRALQKLNSLTLRTAVGKETPFPAFAATRPEGYARFLVDFGTSPKVTWRQLRGFFDIPDELSFKDLTVTRKPKVRRKTDVAEKPNKSNEELEKEDFVNRGSTGCAHSTNIFRKLLGQNWHSVTCKGLAPLDEAAFALAFYEVVEDEESEQTILGQLRLRCAGHTELIDAVTRDLLESGKPLLANFKGSVSVSSEVSRNIIPHLVQGLVYSEAMKVAGYNHADSNVSLKSITNPVVQSVIRETMKQIVHLIDVTGKIPGKINIELGRDLGKSMDERNEIDSGIRKRTTERNTHREEAADILGVEPHRLSDEELLRYELYIEQGGLCPYSGETLPPGRNLFGANLQIDHILPRSRSQDNSYDNKVLVFTHANQNKGNSTPYEFFSSVSAIRWLDFQTTIGSMRGLRHRKRRNLLDSTFAERESEFTTRNLNDTRYIGRVVAAFLQTLYTIAGEKPPTEKESRRRIHVRPGALTSLVRKAWGLEDLKKDLAGNRIGDKHHAVDALICACIGEGQSQFVTALAKAWRDMETRHEHGLVPKRLPIPWPEFRNTVVSALNSINVSRREDRSGRGSLHNDTVYGRDESGTVWKRTTLISKEGSKTTPRFSKAADVEKIRGARQEDVKKNPKNQWFRDALLKWITQGSPTDKAPTDPAGKPIVKVFVEERSNSLRKIPRGWVTNGDMIRCDVFSKKGKYSLIPVYSHHLVHDSPPMRYIKANKPEGEWAEVDETFQFEFSLWRNSRFRVTEKPIRGTTVSNVVEGNFTSLHRGTGQVSYNLPDDHGADTLGVSPVTSLKFEKLYVDRLGRVYPIPKEKRTWRGKVCT